MSVIIQHKRGTASQWTSLNPTLEAGEVGWESDTNKFKIGTGSTVWTSLPYATLTPTELTSGYARLAFPNAFTVGGHSITNNAAGTIPLYIRSATSQTANLTEWQDSSGAILADVDKNGAFSGRYFGPSGSGLLGYLDWTTNTPIFNTGGTAVVGLIVRGASGQVNDLQQWQNNSATVRAYVTSDGSFLTSGTLTTMGNLRVGGLAGTGGGSGVIGIANVGTVPTSNPSGGGVLYVNSGALSYRGTSGSAVTIVNADGTTPYPTLTGNNTFTGNQIWNNSVNLGPGLNSSVGFEIGYTGGSATTPYIDFHSGATATDFDSRIIASGGNGTNGNGTLTYTAGAHNFSGAITSQNSITGQAGVALSGASSPLTLNGSTGTTGQVLTSAGAGTTPTWSSSFISTSSSYFAGHNPEGRLMYNTYLTNDMANARLRGSAVAATQNGVAYSISNANWDAMFDGTASFFNISPTSGFTFPLVITVPLPRTLTYGAWVGLSFGSTTFRANSIQIEVFSLDSSSWVSIFNTTTNTSEDIFASVSGLTNSNATGINQVRYTISSPNSTQLRLQHLWAYNFNSDMWSQTMMPRGGGSFYGPVTNTTIDPATVPLTIKGAASQSTDLLRAQNSSSTTLFKVDQNGFMVAGGATVLSNAVISSSIYGTTQVGIAVRGTSGQTADLQQWQTSTPTTVARIDSGGNLKATNVATLNSIGQMAESNSGALFVMGRATAQASSPGLNTGTLYFRDGTTAGTLRLATRTGASGSEETIVDNLSSTASTAGAQFTGAGGVRTSGLINTNSSQYGNTILFAAPASTTYYQLATLPISSAGTYDHIQIDGIGGGWGSTDYSSYSFRFANRNAFDWKYTLSDRGVMANFKLRAYSQADGSVQIWASGEAGQFLKFAYNISSAQNITTIANPTSTTTAPSGTVVFDSSNTATYPPVESRHGGLSLFGTATGTIPLLVRGVSGQTADLLKVQNSTPTDLFTISSAGLITAKVVSNAANQSRGIMLSNTADTWQSGLYLKSDGSGNPRLTILAPTGGLGEAVSIDAAAKVGFNNIAPTGQVDITTASTTRVPLIIRPQASQTADLFQIRNSGDTSNLFRVTSSGDVAFQALALGSGTIYGSSSWLNIALNNASQIGSIIRGATSQSSDLSQWQSWDGTTATTVLSVGPTGFISSNSGANFNSGLIAISGANSGGQITWNRQTAAASNPGANAGRIYFRDGTTAGTLKLATITGASGIEETIVDNLSSTGSTAGAKFVGAGGVDTAGSLKTTTGLNLSGAASTVTLNGSVGTSGQVLTSAGAGATPTWTTVSGGSFTGGTLTSDLVLAAGSGTVEPLTFQTNSATPTVTSGAMDYDGVVFYQTSNTNPGRALATQEYYYVSSADWNPDFSTSSVVQSFLGTSTRGINVAAGTTYEFEFYTTVRHQYVTNTGISGDYNMYSSTVSGTPTVTFTQQVEYGSNTTSFATATTMSIVRPTTAVSFSASISSGSRYNFLRSRGVIRVTGSGVAKIYPGLNPNNTVGDNVWTVQAGTVFKLKPLGNGTVTTVGAWTA